MYPHPPTGPDPPPTRLYPHPLGQTHPAHSYWFRAPPPSPTGLYSLNHWARCPHPLARPTTHPLGHTPNTHTHTHTTHTCVLFEWWQETVWGFSGRAGARNERPSGFPPELLVFVSLLVLGSLGQKSFERCHLHQVVQGQFHGLCQKATQMCKSPRGRGPIFHSFGLDYCNGGRGSIRGPLPNSCSALLLSSAR